MCGSPKMVSKNSFSMPDELAVRLAQYKKDKNQWEWFNISAVCSKAINEQLKKEGY